MEEVRKQLKRIKNIGTLMLSAGILLFLAGALMAREAGDQEAILRDLFLSLLGGFMALLGSALLYHAVKASRLLGRTGGGAGVQAR